MQVRKRIDRLVDVRHADAATQRQGRILACLALCLMAAGLVFLPFVPLLRDPTAALLAIGLALVLFAGIVHVLRSGRVLLGSVLVLATYLLMIVTGVAVSGRVDNAPQFVALAVTMAGATLGTRQVLVTLGASLAALAIFWQVDRASGGRTVDVVSLVVFSAVVCLVTAVVAVVTGSALRRALQAESQARQTSEELAIALGEVNRTLERRVAERTDKLERALHNQTAIASELAELSVRDALTGLYNRRYLDREVVRLFDESTRNGRPLSVALLDLDSFKSVNDRFGHDIGDEVLRRVAQILVEFTRSADVVARYGGEELALVMPDTTLADGVETCERIRLRLTFEPWDDVAVGLRVTGSFGVGEAAGHDTVWHLLRTTDQRLYAAKSAGRNQVVAVDAVSSPVGA